MKVVRARHLRILVTHDHYLFCIAIQLDTEPYCLSVLFANHTLFPLFPLTFLLYPRPLNIPIHPVSLPLPTSFLS